MTIQDVTASWTVDYVVLVPGSPEEHSARHVPGPLSAGSGRLVADLLADESERWRGRAATSGPRARMRRWLRVVQLLSRNPGVFRLLKVAPWTFRATFRSSDDQLWDPRRSLGHERVWTSREAGLWGARMHALDYGVEFGFFKEFEEFGAFVVDAIPKVVEGTSDVRLEREVYSDARVWLENVLSRGDRNCLLNACEVIPRAFPVRARLLAALGRTESSRALVVDFRPAAPERTPNPEVGVVRRGVVAHGQVPWTADARPIIGCSSMRPTEPSPPRPAWRPRADCMVGAIPATSMREFAGPALFVGSAANWYHFLVEGLSYGEDALRVANQTLPVILESSSPHQVADACRLVTGVDPIRVDLYEAVQMDELFLAGAASPVPHEPLLRDPERLRSLAQSIREAVLMQGISASQGRKIYIRRSRRQLRPLQNAQRLYRLLDNRGFSEVDPHSMTLAEQVRAFAEADVVVAESGAALTNMMFCRPDATVIEIVPYNADREFWSGFAAIFGLSHHGIVSTKRILGRFGLAADAVAVDTGQVAKVLDTCL